MKVEWEMGGVMVITPETQMEVYALEHWVSVNVMKKGSVRAGSIAFGSLEIPSLLQKPYTPAQGGVRG